MRHAQVIRAFLLFRRINRRGVPDFRLMILAQFVSRREINDFAGSRIEDADDQRTRPGIANTFILRRNKIMHF